RETAADYQDHAEPQRNERRRMSAAGTEKICNTDDSKHNAKRNRELRQCLLLCGRRLLHLLQNCRDTPVIRRVERDDPSVFANHNGSERMLQRTLFAGCYADVKELLHLRQFLFTWSSELPVIEGLLRVPAGVSAAVALEHLRRVVCRIEADAEQVCVLVELRIRGKLLVDLRKVTAHARAVVSQRTTGVDEGHQQHFAAILLEVDLLIGLVQECEVRDFIARRGH